MVAIEGHLQDRPPIGAIREREAERFAVLRRRYRLAPDFDVARAGEPREPVLDSPAQRGRVSPALNFVREFPEPVADLFRCGRRGRQANREIVEIDLAQERGALEVGLDGEN